MPVDIYVLIYDYFKEKIRSFLINDFFKFVFYLMFQRDNYYLNHKYRYDAAPSHDLIMINNSRVILVK